MPVVDGLMAGSADHEGFPAHPGHELCPPGLRPSCPGEVGEFADLVDFRAGRRVAPLAPPCPEPDGQLLAAGGQAGKAVGDDCLLLPFQRNATEPGDQWFPARPFDGGLEADARPVRGGDGCPEFAGHRRHGRAVPGGQRLEQRGLGCPAEPVQPEDVAGEQVVLDDAPVLRAVGADDQAVGQVHQLGAPRGFAVRAVGGALGRDHRQRDAQPDHAVDGGPVAAVLDGDLVAEEGRCLGAGMRDQGLVLVEFQFEVVTQELGQALLDLPGFGLGPGEPEKVIVGLCRGPDYADFGARCPGQGGGRVHVVGIIPRGR